MYFPLTLSGATATAGFLKFFSQKKEKKGPNSLLTKSVQKLHLLKLLAKLAIRIFPQKHFRKIAF